MKAFSRKGELKNCQLVGGYGSEKTFDQYFSCVHLFETQWTVACQAPLSMGFSRQEFWSGLPFPLQGIFPTLGLNVFLKSPALAGGFFTTNATFFLE